jgi:hypothetical protein
MTAAAAAPDNNSKIALSRKLTASETSVLVARLGAAVPLSLKDDLDDLMDYAVAMVSNQKTVDYVVRELREMEMVDDSVVQALAQLITSFIQELEQQHLENSSGVDTNNSSSSQQIQAISTNNDTIAHTTEQQQQQQESKVISLKSSRGNALTMSGALGSARRGEAAAEKKSIKSNTIAENPKKQPTTTKHGAALERLSGGGRGRVAETSRGKGRAGADTRGRGRGADRTGDRDASNRIKGNNNTADRSGGGRSAVDTHATVRRDDQRGQRAVQQVSQRRDDHRGGREDHRGGRRGGGGREERGGRGGGGRTSDRRDDGRAPATNRRGRDDLEHEPDFVPAGRGGRGRGGRDFDGNKRIRTPEGYDSGHYDQGSGGLFDEVYDTRNGEGYYEGEYYYKDPVDYHDQSWRGGGREFHGRGRGRFVRGGRGRGRIPVSHEGQEASTQEVSSLEVVVGDSQVNGEDAAAYHPSPMVQSNYYRGGRGRSGFIARGRGRGRDFYRAQVQSALQSMTWTRKKKEDESANGEGANTSGGGEQQE